LAPVGAPIGFSGDVANVGASLFSAHGSSPGQGRRPFPRSARGCPETGDLGGLRSGIINLR
jgi:hypothetical protein